MPKWFKFQPIFLFSSTLQDEVGPSTPLQILPSTPIIVSPNGDRCKDVVSSIEKGPNKKK